METVTFAGVTKPWRTFYEEMFAKQKVDKNLFEQLLFPTACSELSFVPLPVLSTPFILLVLDARALGPTAADRDSLLLSLYFRSRDTISKHLYSRLIDDVTVYLETSGETISEEELVNRFVRELCKVLRPLSYRINSGEIQKYYKSWPAVEDSEYTLLLTGRKKYEVKFKLTSFFYVNFETKSGEWNFFHRTEIYKANKNQSSLLISKIFNLLHRHWGLLKSADERAQLKLAKKLDSKEFKDFINTAEKIKSIFGTIKVHSAHQYSYFVITDKAVSITINNIKIVDPKDVGGINQFFGFKYIHYILRTAYSNKDRKCQCTPDELVEAEGTPKSEKISNHDLSDIALFEDANISQGRSSIEEQYVFEKLTINDLYSDFYHLVKTFFSQWETEVKLLPESGSKVRSRRCRKLFFYGLLHIVQV